MSTTTFVFALLTLITAGASQHIKLRTLTSCVCPAHLIEYECIINGSESSILTTWRGSALQNCDNGNEITLRHSQFDSNYSRSKICRGSGVVTGQAVSANQNVYISRLILHNITSLDIIGRSIECASYINGIQEVASIQILLSAQLPPPSNLRSSLINLKQLILVWDSPFSTCPFVYYSVGSNNCGDCPNNTNSNSIMCSISSLRLPQTCTFWVQSVICSDVYGDVSDQYSIVLQVPDAPKISVIPEYTVETLYLNKIGVIINHTNNTNEPYTMDTTYTILYFDTISGIFCGSNTIFPSLGRGMYNITFDIDLSSCALSSVISVSAFASNTLGIGPNSDNILISAVNRFVDLEVDFVKAKSITCTYWDERTNFSRYLQVDFEPSTGTPCTVESRVTTRQKNTNDSGSVTLQIKDTNNESFIYCYRVTARDGDNMIRIFGNYTDCNPHQLNTSESGICENYNSVLGIDSGIVCFNGIRLGSTAVYHCRNCGYEKFLESTLSRTQTCGLNAELSGAKSLCDCRFDSTFRFLFGVIGGSMIIILAIIILILFAVVIILLRAKSNPKLTANRSADFKIYEEVDNVSQQFNVTTADNVAYASRGRLANILSLRCNNEARY